MGIFRLHSITIVPSNGYPPSCRVIKLGQNLTIFKDNHEFTSKLPTNSGPDSRSLGLLNFGASLFI